VEVSGSNALQVPGASYLITYPAGFVQDALSYQCTAYTDQPLTVGGVAKPFIRIQKKQDSVIINATPSATVPRLGVANPAGLLQTGARIDCRTPGATIRYAINTADTNVTALNWGTGGPNDSDSNPTQPALPASATSNVEYSGEITLGNTNYQGYQWRVRARAFAGGNNSEGSEEIAYRTVLTYQVRAMEGYTAGQNPGRNFGPNGEVGNQVWIRGGDAIGTSSVPGFPLTWQDDWTDLQTNRKRAGIRLMHPSDITTSFDNASTWRWVTWEINVPTYFDMIMGRDTASSATMVTQYGPQQWTYQRAGWTSFKEQYRLFPGKHRWLYVNGNDNFDSKGAVNFSATFSARPTNLTVSYP
jgi:hypothetical protein